MGKEEHTRQYIIQALIELDAESEKPIGRKALQRKGINQYQIQKLIPEGLTELKQQLGLKISPQERPLSDDKLFEKIDKIVSDLKLIPSWAKLRRETGITDKVFIQRFGKKGKHEVFSHYRKWLEKHQPESKNIKFVDSYFKDQVEVKTSRSQQEERKGSATRTKWPKGFGKEYGAPLNFGNLIYEPTTEQGVVFLFGMVSRFLGFSIESVRDEWPDCEAKRYIKGKRDRQQSVKIEFEPKSRDYNHPIKGCDIIVCWENNWGKDCPLEVIELRSEIKKLRELPEFSQK